MHRRQNRRVIVVFQDDQTKYLIVGPVLVILFVMLGGLYETFVQDHAYWHETVVATIKWIGPAVASTITILAIWRAYEMVAANRYREQGRQEMNEAWTAWLRRKEEAEAEGRPFNELNPAEKAEQERRR